MPRNLVAMLQRASHGQVPADPIDAVQLPLDRGRSDVNASASWRINRYKRTSTTSSRLGGGETALLFAAEAGHAEIVKQPRSHAAAVNRRDLHFRTALSRARQAGEDAVIQGLIATGATDATDAADAAQ